MNRLCINCGSNLGANPIFKIEAANVGKYLAKNKIGIIYGGANVGLMGEVANAALSENGEVIGVIPKNINDKVGHPHVTKLFVVDSMHERKQMMFDLSDGFIALPGGPGTIEEIFELVTWAQLGFHKKPCGFLNIANYYDDLFNFIGHAVENQFMKKSHREMIMKEEKIEILVERFRNYEAPTVEKWIR
jgi:uncharacterized protein (TIGR00730 family)